MFPIAGQQYLVVLSSLATLCRVDLYCPVWLPCVESTCTVQFGYPVQRRPISCGLARSKFINGYKYSCCLPMLSIKLYFQLKCAAPLEFLNLFLDYNTTVVQTDSLKIFLLGGGVNFNLRPLQFFLHNSKSIGLRQLKFSDFSYIPKALPVGLKPGFNTNCLNDCFCL